MWTHYYSKWWTHYATFIVSFLHIPTCRLYKKKKNHLLTTFHFKATQCIFFKIKNTVNQMDWKSMRTVCREFMFICYATSIISASLLLRTFPFLCPTHQSEKTFSNLQTHQSIPVHTKIYKPTTTWKNFSKPAKIEAWTLPDVKAVMKTNSSISHFFSYLFPSNTRSLSFHFLHLTLSIHS